MGECCRDLIICRENLLKVADENGDRQRWLSTEKYKEEREREMRDETTAFRVHIRTKEKIGTKRAKTRERDDDDELKNWRIEEFEIIQYGPAFNAGLQAHNHLGHHQDQEDVESKYKLVHQDKLQFMVY